MRKDAVFSTNAFRLIMAGVLSLLFLLGCSDNDDELVRTYQEGKPSCIIAGDNTKTFIYYQGDRISRIKETDGATYNFEYKDNELTSISFYQTDKNIMDGFGGIHFKREGNKIMIESSGAPSFILAVKELELDDNDIPIKMTDMGFYEQTANGLEKMREGKYYTLFHFDDTTKNLLKMETFDIATNKLEASFQLVYDDSYGIMSNLNMPLWFYAYYNHSFYNSYTLKAIFRLPFFNYANNLIKATYDIETTSYYGYVDLERINEISEHGIINYSYMYNKNKYPILMGIDGENDDMYSIAY